MSTIKLNEIKPSKYNPRKISNTELEKLENSIRKFGFVEPIIINTKNNTIIGGHQRYKVLKEIQSDMPLELIQKGDIGIILTTQDLKLDNEHDEKALNIALNKISGEWDNEKLKPLLEEISLSPVDVELTGFDKIELEELNITLTDNPLQNVEDDEYTYNEKEITTNITTGDMFKLGKHTLKCGDSLKQETLNDLMQDQPADMCFTDLPFELDEDILPIIYENTKPNAEIFIMHNERHLAHLITAHDKYFRRLFCVDFKIATLVNNNLPMTQIDFIGHFRRESPTRFVNLKDSFSTLIESEKTRKENKNNFGFKHAKNPKLPAEFIKHYTKKEETVLDCFGGSGSTLIACEQLNRHCYMVEKEPVYCQIIIDRWEEFTGLKAEKVNYI